MDNDVDLNLGDHFSLVIEEQIALGRYRDKSEVLRAALRLLEEHELRLTALRTALIDGEQSGASMPFDFDAFVTNKRGAKLAAS